MLRNVLMDSGSCEKSMSGPRNSNRARSFIAAAALQPLSVPKRPFTEWPPVAICDDAGVGDCHIPATPNQASAKTKEAAAVGSDCCDCSVPSSSSSSCYNNGRMELQQQQPAKSNGSSSWFEQQCSKVADHIYLGGDAVAKNRDILRDNGITHVLNCVGFVCPEYFRSELVYKTLWLHDSPWEDITSIFYDVFDYFEEVKQEAGKVFVHCCKGVSRSASLVIAYLIWRNGQTFEDAFEHVKSLHKVANPNFGFCSQLLQLEKRVVRPELSPPDSKLTMYRIAPHSSYAPLHLVPKMVINAGADALDSRGAFIVQVPSAVFFWIGHGCHTLMLNIAQISASRFLRYERLHCPIMMVKEGEEPHEFCSLITENQTRLKEPQKPLLHLGRGSIVGNKIVKTYDIDYELFRKAMV